jgi:dolichol-phosphate mannosyltransferase
VSIEHGGPGSIAALVTRLSVIVPVWNEAEGIDALVDGLATFFEKSGVDAEVIFVDDGSADDTSARLAKAKHHGYVPRLVTLSRNFGSHAALRAGIQHATGDLCTFLYADLQDPPELIREMLDEVKRGHAIVWAQRREVSEPIFSRIFSVGYNAMMRRFAIPTFPNRGFDVVMFNRKVMAELNKNIEAHSSIFLQIMNLGFRQTYVEYDKQQRKIGKSKWTFWKKVKLVVDSFVAFSYAPVRFVSVLGISLALAGFGFAGYVLFRAIVYKDLSPGWPALASILLIGFGVTNVSIGILAEYIWRTLDAARHRPTFVIDEVKDLTETRHTE